jgi:hypothetical protein
LERFQEERFDKQNNLIKNVKLFQLNKIKKIHKTEPVDLVFTSSNKTYFEKDNKDKNTYQPEIHPIVHYKYSSLLEFPVKTYYMPSYNNLAKYCFVHDRKFEQMQIIRPFLPITNFNQRQLVMSSVLGFSFGY